MAYELVYTSAPEGLNRGSSGFCVVACTKGLGPRLIVTLEGLSAYKPLYPHYSPMAWENPISRSHYIYEANGEQQHILSRICFNGVDYTQRSNKLASHLVLSQNESKIAKGGPSSLLLLENLFKDSSWQIKAEYFSKQKEIPETTSNIKKCSLWEAIMGDAGWAGYLAQTYIDSPNKNVYIIYTPDQNKHILPLIHEAMSLIPEDLRWQITFNTYFVHLPVGMNCCWRCCPIDSEAALVARRSPSNIIINITKPFPLDKDGELISVSRTGIFEEKEEKSNEVEKIYNIEKNEETSIITNSSSSKICSGQANLGNVALDSSVKIIDNTSAKDTENHFVDSRTYNSINSSSSLVHKKYIFFFCIILFLILTIGGTGFYIISLYNTNDNYEKSKSELLKLNEAYKCAIIRFNDSKNQKKSVKTKHQIDNLIYEMENLVSLLESIKKASIKLSVYQKLFEKNQKKDDYLCVDNTSTPIGLAEICDNSREEIKKELSDLNNLGDKIMKTKIKPVPSSIGSEKQKLPKQEQVVVLSKQLNKKIAIKKNIKRTIKISKEALTLRADKVEYLWTKSKRFHKLSGKEKFHVNLGNIDPKDIFIYLIPYRKTYKVGEKIKCEPDLYDHRAIFKTEFDCKTGVLYFIAQGPYVPSDNTEILIKISEQKIFPLYFRIDKSKIYPNKKRDNIEIIFDENVTVKIKKSSMKYPSKFFAINDTPCVRDPILRLSGSEIDSYAITKDNDYFIWRWEDKILKKNKNSLRGLSKIEEKINSKPLYYIKKLGKTFKKELDHYNEINSKVQNKSKLKKFYKKFGLSNNISIHELKEKIDNYKDKNKDEELNYWIDKYNEREKILEVIRQKIKEEIPLKDLKIKRFSHSETLKEEKEKLQKIIKNRQRIVEESIAKSSVSLVDGDQEYIQFSINALQ